MPTVVLSKLTQRWWKDENPTVDLSNLTRRWRGTENPTVVMPYLDQRRLKNGNPTVALPTLMLRWFNFVKPTPTYSTITNFYRRWFDVTLQTGIGPYGYGKFTKKLRFDRPTVGFSAFHQRWVTFDKPTVGIRLFADAWFEYLTYDCLYLNSRFKTRI
jgi:hypothetical protein